MNESSGKNRIMMQSKSSIFDKESSDDTFTEVRVMKFDENIEESVKDVIVNDV